MATKRKEISKRMRFEVFKRDSFTCQYCGRMAPDVVLQVDHIKPVSKGGKNEMINLVTSCFDCNNGKRDIELSDDAAVKKQEKQLLELVERKEQLEMMLKWRDSMNDIENDMVNAVAKVFSDNTKWGVNDYGKKTIKKWVKEFSLNEILDATEIAINQYYDETEDGWSKAFDKVPGIIVNKKRQADDPRYYRCNYLVKIARTNYKYCNDKRLKEYLFSYMWDEEQFEQAKDIICRCRNWSEMKYAFQVEFGGVV